jgi:hypothetical protein
VFGAIALALAPSVAAAPPTGAAPSPASSTLVGSRILVLGFDPLGLEADKVERLELLFRKELERLAGAPSPSRRDVAKLFARDRALAGCGGEPACLAAIGKKLGVALVVSGNVAQLGDSYVVNVKVVDVATAAEVRRVVSDPLRGTPDELIEAVRVAAYRLLAPDAIHGAIAVLADRPGATVELDGRTVGVTPLPGPIARLALGAHRLRVRAPGHAAFTEEVAVRFQKTSRVVVRLAPEASGPFADGRGAPPPPRDRPWYRSPWALVGMGVAAIAIGGAIGYAVAHDEELDCGADPGKCR